MMESILKTINWSIVKNLVSFCMVFHLFSDNFCRKRCLMISLSMWSSSHLQGKQLPRSKLNKIPYFNRNISASKCVIPLHCRSRVVQPCTCKECEIHSHITIRPLARVICMEHIVLDCITQSHKEDLHKSVTDLAI